MIEKKTGTWAML